VGSSDGATVDGSGGSPLPADTTKSTELPCATELPADGFSLMTLPAATVALTCCVTVPSLSPAPVIVIVAAA
jgi:hypothetical protein